MTTPPATYEVKTEANPAGYAKQQAWLLKAMQAVAPAPKPLTDTAGHGVQQAEAKRPA